jgi:acetylornithine aminotransferase
MNLINRWPKALANNYGTPPVALIRGNGARVWDENDREYIDLLAGIATNSLGHAHPALVKAVSEQVALLGHVSNLVAHPQTVRLAERLLALLDPSGARGGRVFFSNSGAEANEAAIKLARRHASNRGITVRSCVFICW